MPKGVSFLFYIHMKQKFELEIDCPKGYKPIVEGTTIKFVSNKPDWKEIKTVEQVLDYCKKYFYKESVALINNLNYLDEQDYEYWIILYRLIVMAITDNEEISLTKGDIYYPYVQFCELGKEKSCWGDTIIGHISYGDNIYAVVGNYSIASSCTGLGYFSLSDGISYSTTDLGFRVVSLLEKAQHISKYFGKVVFYIMYGGTNCNWEWKNL